MSLRNGAPSTLEALITRLESKTSGTKPQAPGESLEHAKELRSILDHLDYTGSRRRNFRHYGPRSRIESILKESCFYLTDGSNWNDRYDRDRFNSSYAVDKRFGICFSAATGESIAMWMLYGGIDGNGAMINFDKKTLDTATVKDEYECGFFVGDTFKKVKSIPASDIAFNLIDVLYFSEIGRDEKMTIARVGDDRKARISADAFGFISPIAKHEAWKYENEVRLVASVPKLALGIEEPEITAIRIPFSCSDGFADTRVFNSPIADSSGRYRDSLLHGTVEWNLCSNCPAKSGSGL